MAAATLDHETLDLVARDGTMDYERWPSLLEPLLARLDEIVHSDFPIPSIPPPDSPPAEQAKLLASESPTQSRNESSNIVSSTRSPRSLPPVPAFDSSTSTRTSRVPESTDTSENNEDAAVVNADSVPEQLITQLTSIQDTLRSAFAERPPHTIQRLAELVMSPKRHYKTLPAWLRAVDRVVSVSSTANIFPLPHAQPLPNSVIDTGLVNGLVNGDSNGTGNAGGILWSNTSRDGALGSDESLGGALLTPIPWMINRTGGDSDSGSPDLGLLSGDSNEILISEREDGAVTQGELIRMEQEAGIVPVSQNNRPTRTENGDAMFEEDREEIGPHARGPDIIGVEDMGLQNGHGVELQLGRTAGEVSDGEVVSLPIEQGAQPENDGGDVVLTDADGGVPSETRPQNEGGDVGPDIVDSTTL